jgi:hypothetical protein
MRFIPSATEERQLAMRGRARRWRRAGLIDDGARRRLEADSAIEWKTFPFFPRAGLFLLTFLAGGAARFFMETITRSAVTILVGIVLIAAAEHLIARKQFFRTGIEEGLWCAGLLILIVDGFRLAAPALALAVWFGFAVGIAAILLSLRLLHTLVFLAGITILVTWAAGFFDSPAVAGWALLAAGGIALAAHLPDAARPFRASATGWLALGAPIAAWALVREASLAGALAIAIGAAVVWIAAGIRWRSRFALAGGALAAGAFGFELLEPRAWSIEWKLIAGGLAAFFVAVAIERWLRAPRRGFTSQAIEGDAEPRLFEMAAVAAVAPTAAAPRDGLAAGEGKFGGGGASGEY